MTKKILLMWVVVVVISFALGAALSGYYFYSRGYVASSDICRDKLQNFGINVTPPAELKSVGGKIVSGFRDGRFVVRAQFPSDPLAQGDKGAVTEDRTVIVDANTYIYTSRMVFDAKEKRPIKKKVVVPAEDIVAGKMVSITSETDITKNLQFTAKEISVFE